MTRVGFNGPPSELRARYLAVGSNTLDSLPEPSESDSTTTITAPPMRVVLRTGVSN